MRPLREHSPARLFAESAATVFAVGMGLSFLSTLTFPGRGRPQSPEMQSFTDYLTTLPADQRAILGALGNPFLRIGHSSGEGHIMSTATTEPIIDVQRIMARIGGLLGRHRSEQQAADAEAQAQRLVIQVEQARSVQIARALHLSATDPIRETSRLIHEPTSELLSPILIGLLERAMPGDKEDIAHPGLATDHVAAIKKTMVDQATSLRNQARAVSQHRDRGWRQQADRLSQQAQLIDRLVDGEKDKPETALPVLVARAIELGFVERAITLDLTLPENAALNQTLEAFLHANYEGPAVRPGNVPEPVIQQTPPAPFVPRRGVWGVWDRLTHLGGRAVDITGRLADRMPIMQAGYTRPNLRADLLARLDTRVADLIRLRDARIAAVAQLEETVRRESAAPKGQVKEKTARIHKDDLERARQAVESYTLQLAIAQPVTRLFHMVNDVEWHRLNPPAAPIAQP